MTRRDIRVLHLTRDHPFERRYGLARSLASVVDELRALDVDVTWLNQGDLGARARQSMHLFNRVAAALARVLPGSTDFAGLLGLEFERAQMGRVAARLDRRDPHTHVHCHDPVLASWFARFRRGGVPWGVTEHGYGCFVRSIEIDGARLGPRIAGRLRNGERRTLGESRWVCVPTAIGRDRLASDLAVSPPAHWHVIPHARPRLDLPARESARRSLGWSDEGFYVLALGRLAPLKRFPLLVEAVAGLQAPVPVYLVVLGEGDTAPLVDRARELDMESRLHVSVSDDVSPWLAAADAYASASASESFGIANLEALSAGLPAVCTAVGGVPEVVGDAALTVPPDDTGALRAALQRVIDSRELREDLARRGRARAAGWPDAAQIAARYRDLYRAVR